MRVIVLAAALAVLASGASAQARQHDDAVFAMPAGWGVHGTGDEGELYLAVGADAGCPSCAFAVARPEPADARSPTGWRSR